MKPENVLIDGRAWPPTDTVSDFGISGLTDGSSITRLTGFVGTPAYMAPELSSSDPVTAAVDIYATGIILYELLSGTTPFAGGHPMATMKRHLEELPARPPGLSGELWVVLWGMLAKDSAHRPDAVVAGAQLRHVVAINATVDPLPSRAFADQTLDPGWIGRVAVAADATPLIITPGHVDPCAMPLTVRAPDDIAHTMHRTPPPEDRPHLAHSTVPGEDREQAWNEGVPLLPAQGGESGVDDTSATFIRGAGQQAPLADQTDVEYPRRPGRRKAVGAVAGIVLLALAGVVFALTEGLSGPPLRWSSPQTIAPRVALGSVSCASPSFCVAGGDTGSVVTYNGQSWSSPKVVAPGEALTSVSCASPSFCVAGGDTGSVVTYNGQSWSSPQTVDPGVALSSVSCASPSSCVAVTSKGQAVYYR